MKFLADIKNKEYRQKYQELQSYFDGIKIGMPWVYACGLDSIKYNPNMFLDLKLCDTPDTIYRSVINILDRCNPMMLSIMSSCGPDSIAAAKSAIDAYRSDCKLICVTILTSIEQYENIAYQSNPVAELAMMSKQHGADGVVCSYKNLNSIKSILPELITIVPSIGNYQPNNIELDCINIKPDFAVIGRLMMEDSFKEQIEKLK